MKALYFDGKSLRLLKDYPHPHRKQGWSIVKVTYAGICGTDLQILEGYAGFKGVPGHEFVGIVSDSEDIELIGKRVVGEINVGCGRCSYCLSGLERHCPERRVLGIKELNGSFAEYLTLPTKNLHVIPDSLTDEEAVFVEPLAACYEILEQIKLDPNSRILVLGDGRMGVLVSQVISKIAPETILAGRHEEKLRRIKALGVKTMHVEEVEGLFDLVVEVTGRPEGVAHALKHVKPRGTIILKTTTATNPTINLSKVVVNEVTILGSRCGRFRPAIHALSIGQIHVRSLIDGVYALEDWEEAFQKVKERNVFKILLKP